MTPTDRDLYPDDAYYEALWARKEQAAHEVAPSLAAIVHADNAEALAQMRGEEFPDVQESRYVSDAYLARHFDGSGCYLAPWAIDSSYEWLR